MSSIHAVLSEAPGRTVYRGQGRDRGFQQNPRHRARPARDYRELRRARGHVLRADGADVHQGVKEALFKRIPMKEIAQPEWIARGWFFSLLMTPVT